MLKILEGISMKKLMNGKKECSLASEGEGSF